MLDEFVKTKTRAQRQAEFLSQVPGEINLSRDEIGIRDFRLRLEIDLGDKEIWFRGFDCADPVVETTARLSLYNYADPNAGYDWEEEQQVLANPTRTFPHMLLNYGRNLRDDDPTLLSHGFTQAVGKIVIQEGHKLGVQDVIMKVIPNSIGHELARNLGFTPARTIRKQLWSGDPEEDYLVVKRSL